MAQEVHGLFLEHHISLSDLLLLLILFAKKRILLCPLTVRDQGRTAGAKARKELKNVLPDFSSEMGLTLGQKSLSSFLKIRCTKAMTKRDLFLIIALFSIQHSGIDRLNGLGNGCR